MALIVPNILTADVVELESKLVQLKGVVDWIHFDIIDGDYVNNKTITLAQLSQISLLKNFNFFLHLMIVDFQQQLKLVKKTGAKVVIGQIETIFDQDKFINFLKLKNIQAGFSLDYQTKINKIKPDVFSQLDVILIMTIQAGWSGQKFKKNRLNQVKNLKTLKQKNNYKFKIAVDGGVNKDNIKDCVRAGADILFTHDAVWKSNNIKTAIKQLERLSKNA